MATETPPGLVRGVHVFGFGFEEGVKQPTAKLALLSERGSPVGNVELVSLSGRSLAIMRTLCDSIEEDYVALVDSEIAHSPPEEVSFNGADDDDGWGAGG